MSNLPVLVDEMMNLDLDPSIYSGGLLYFLHYPEKNGVVNELPEKDDGDDQMNDESFVEGLDTFQCECGFQMDSYS